MTKLRFHKDHTALIGFLIFLAILVVAIAFSWCVTAGIIFLICKCFSLKFSLAVATGIWLAMFLVSGTFCGKNS